MTLPHLEAGRGGGGGGGGSGGAANACIWQWHLPRMVLHGNKLYLKMYG